METVINQLEEISADERMRELYRAREKSRLDMISKLKYAENKGRKEGREEGGEEGREEGEALALSRTVMKLLSTKFGALPKEIKNKIPKLDISV